MQFISFDIETVPGDFDSLSASQQEYLLRGAATEQDIEKRKGEMALTALTGRVVCIGLAHCEIDEKGEGIIKNKIALCVKPDNFDTDQNEGVTINREGNIQFPLSDGSICYLGDEEWVLKVFWEKLEIKEILAKKENKSHSLISFNGRGFDAPFLMHRSAIYRIRPYRNIMDGTRYNYSKHIDLLDELTFYSPSSSGPTRRFNFDFYARSFGITSPKAEGVDGSKVSVLFDDGKIKDIAEYCLRDVVATWDLFLYWNKYLNFKR